MRDWIHVHMPQTLRGFLEMAAQRGGVRVADIVGPDTSRRCSRPRQEFMYLAHRIGGFSEPRIGRFIDRDASTVHHGIYAHAARLSVDKAKLPQPFNSEAVDTLAA